MKLYYCYQAYRYKYERKYHHVVAFIMAESCASATVKYNTLYSKYTEGAYEINRVRVEECEDGTLLYKTY